MEKIREAEIRDIKRIKQMCDEYISYNFYSEEYLKDVCNCKDRYILVYVNDDDIPVAVLYMFVTTFSEAVKILKIPDNLKEFEGIKPDDEIGVFKTTFTDKDYRRSGILYKLMSNCEDVLRNRGIKMILLNALMLPSGKIPAQSGINNSKFKMIAKIEKPWSDVDSYCPYCENQYCTCDAILCIKEIG